MKKLVDLVVDESNVEELCAASFKDFHAKGFDYLCLKRTPEHTIKLYLFDGDVSNLSEVVNPHDHRYAFRTTVLTGSLIDYRFVPGGPGDEVYQAFDYRTPLNGGDGFTFRGEETLARSEHKIMFRGDQLMTAPDDLHTIQVHAPQTMILLEQYSDVVPLDQPTSTWVRKGYPAPDTRGLYNKFTTGQFMDRLKQVMEILNA